MSAKNAYALRNFATPYKVVITGALVAGLGLSWSAWLISIVAVNWSLSVMTLVDWGNRLAMLPPSWRYGLLALHALSLVLLLELTRALIRRMPLPRLSCPSTARGACRSDPIAASRAMTASSCSAMPRRASGVKASHFRRSVKSRSSRGRTLYLGKLVGFGNKVRVMLDWTLDLSVERSSSQIHATREQLEAHAQHDDRQPQSAPRPLPAGPALSAQS